MLLSTLVEVAVPRRVITANKLQEVSVKLGEPFPCKLDFLFDVGSFTLNFSCKFKVLKLKFQFPNRHSVRFLKLQSDRIFQNNAQMTFCVPLIINDAGISKVEF